MIRVLIDINHPKQVHFFKHLIWKLRERGDQVLVTSRQKDVTTQLLESLEIEHQCLSTAGRGLVGLGFELVGRNIRMWRLARRFKPDVMLALAGVSIGPVGAILGVPRLMLEDTEHARLQQRLGLPFATRIFTGTGYEKDFGKRQVRFRGVSAWAYLAPQYFQPDPQPLIDAGVNPDEPYIVLRIVSWSAAHDRGLEGDSLERLKDAIAKLSEFGRVLISAEGAVPADLQALLNPVPVEHLHDLLAYARLYIGQGGAMAAEAAVLGVPTVFSNPLRVGYLQALESEFELVCNTRSITEGVDVARRWLEDDDLNAKWAQRRERLEQSSEDIVDFMLRLIDRTCQKNHTEVKNA